MADALTQIYNAINPFEPLEPDNPLYVDCNAERGDTDIILGLGREIVRSDRFTCQLFAGHRGAGKSTELLRLRKYLEENGCFVVYFAAVGEEDGDIDPQDVEYGDILLACARHLLEKLTEADPQPLVNWFRDRAIALQEVMQTEIKVDSVDVGIAKWFAQVTATIRAVPTQRRKIRELVYPHTVTLVNALNEFIADAQHKLPSGQSKLVVIADNLDRIVPIVDDQGRSNHDEIYLDRSEQLRGLDCHLIYTVPISLVYSSRANDLKDRYGNPELLPMIMVQTPDGQSHAPGINKMRQVILKRVEPYWSNASLDADIFESADLVEMLCLASGGHVRELMLLLKEAINQVSAFPITAKALRRAIAETRDTYRRTVNKDQWAVLAKVAHVRNIDNDEPHRDLLFRRCILEYRYYDDNDALQCWYDVHPLLKSTAEFKAANDAYKP
ncbi:MAG: ATP-binding protein [Cyanothece sp. SIO2G6]|nr:ATP-binding protein [Cyanothece sp. SIO2G6]